MAGVGKSTALIGIAHDRDIREHFVHGVLFLSIGVAATVGDVTNELEKIMRFTGAATHADKVQSSASMADAVSKAAIWFRGKRILFLIDDIWPNAFGPQGYLPELEGLLQGSEDSRIVISTRSLQIATTADRMSTLVLVTRAERLRWPFLWRAPHLEYIRENKILMRLGEYLIYALDFLSLSL